MHVTIDGQFKSLAVRMYSMNIDDYEYMFFDNYDQYNEWVNREIAKGKWKIDRVGNFKDTNYLLNEMLKSKGTRWGEILYEIYCRHYPDSDQKVNVWLTWNGKPTVKGKEYFAKKKTWYNAVVSMINSEAYTLTVNCRTCKRESIISALEITNVCPKCKLI